MTTFSITRDDESLTVELSGTLDGALGEQLLEVTRVALAVAPEVVIDLAPVTGWTHEGLDALFECTELGARVPSEGDPSEGDRAHPDR
jgi:hypothetical protein